MAAGHVIDMKKSFSLISGNITRVTSVISVLDCDQAFRVPQASDI